MKKNNNEIIRKFVELDYNGCCHASGKEYYKVIGPAYMLKDDVLESSISRTLEWELVGRCSQCGPSLKIINDLSELSEEDKAEFSVVDVFDYTDTKVDVSLEKDLRYMYCETTLRCLENELGDFKKNPCLSNKTKVYLELKDFNGVKISGALCFEPILDENDNIVLKGFVENVEIPVEDAKKQVYCTKCINGENLIKSVVDDDKNLKPRDCYYCHPFNFEDSASFELRDKYKGVNVNKLAYREYKYLRSIAIDLIEEYHKDDVDKGGHPYINHLVRVSSGCKTYEAKIAGLLHDIIEDTECTVEILLSRGIPQFIIDIILLVSRKEDESYEEFINRLILSGNKYAMELKCSDLRDNCDLSRLEGLSDDVIKKGEKRVINRYLPSLLKIERKLIELN